MENYTVYYQTGGRDNFKWHKCAPVATTEEAIKLKASIIKAGKVAYYSETGILNAIGLPDTFGVKYA